MGNVQILLTLSNKYVFSYSNKEKYFRRLRKEQMAKKLAMASMVLEICDVAIYIQCKMTKIRLGKLKGLYVQSYTIRVSYRQMVLFHKSNQVTLSQKNSPHRCKHTHSPLTTVVLNPWKPMDHGLYSHDLPNLTSSLPYKSAIQSQEWSLILAMCDKLTKFG